MNNYTIYCTYEQTKKALELGAPIEILSNYTEYRALPLVKCKDGNDRHCIIPTAEQMIGWLEEQGIVIIFMATMKEDLTGYTWIAHICHFEDKTVWVDVESLSHKVATIAAIDAALEYLEKILNNNGHYPLHRRTDKESL